MRLGNDIVDRKVDAELHPRFLSRILHPVERTLYQGLSAAQIGTIRNWAPPAVDGGIAAVPGASAATATSLHAVGVDYGASQLSSCGTGTLTWDFGDGGHDTGTLVSHRFAAGTAHVTLTIDSACGGSTTRLVARSIVT